MLTRRNWVLRTSIVLNIVVLLYVGTHVASSRNGGLDMLEELQAGGRQLASLDVVPDSGPPGSDNPDVGSPPHTHTAALVQGTTSPPGRQSTTVATSTEHKEVSSTEGMESQRSLADIIGCVDRTLEPRTEMRGDYWVLYNYVPASRQFHCWESITYTTHADFTFLDNLETLLERWQGPISLALHAPGTDLTPTLDTIRYLHECTSAPVSEYVTFHVYFPSKHVPKQVPHLDKIFSEHFNCSKPPPWTAIPANTIYKAQKKLLYPVNVGRNIARESAVTHYILPSDIELYPSPGVIPDFLEMIRRQDPPLLRQRPKVFPLSIFELESNMSLPVNKSDLVSMLKNGSAIPFHKKVCPGCHNVPKSKEWMNTPASDGLRVFHIGKRTGYFVHWEPIFIGTHQDPLYDERLSWEGKSDKMTQGYVLCVLDYEFQILDNAFLVHKPGIKTLKKDPARALLAGKTNSLIRKIIFPELRVLFGVRKGCAV
ncbi:beta-1,4-glucuronyltransferase 1-like isoform X1 [Macrosteles quadrilineatus]|uniref:beta-1,4-glucuronyltransferase 1-like isoform X1 n=1 Tax=Macrosteles quadrilineatus TaxID=74068 RepID=UPI0023E233AD|nr:beta-1,4-glucuronyltransferase 1-like isoform X1 [Macrosteles quadrilineatus]XP_054270286.1 beta-1,4-glucuronyltransferase 1-like isoform X1 [Macrosteles quadrilineatus]